MLPPLEAGVAGLWSGKKADDPRRPVFTGSTTGSTGLIDRLHTALCLLQLKQVGYASSHYQSCQIHFSSHTRTSLAQWLITCSSTYTHTFTLRRLQFVQPVRDFVWVRRDDMSDSLRTRGFGKRRWCNHKKLLRYEGDADLITMRYCKEAVLTRHGREPEYSDRGLRYAGSDPLDHVRCKIVSWIPTTKAQ